MGIEGPDSGPLGGGTTGGGTTGGSPRIDGGPALGIDGGGSGGARNLGAATPAIIVLTYFTAGSEPVVSRNPAAMLMGLI